MVNISNDDFPEFNDSDLIILLGLALANNTSSCDPLEPSPFLEIRYWLIGVVGFIICSMGIIFNIILLLILLKPALRTTYLSYLAALAVIDINIAVTYICVMCTAMWYEFHSNFFLYSLWHVCLPFFFTLSRIATLASSYLVVACTAERYLEVVQLLRSRIYVQITCTKRYVAIACVILASVIFRIVVYWELDVQTNESCNNTFSYFILKRTWLVDDYYYSKIYSFYALHIVQVFFPFLALLVLNFLIVQKWKMVLHRNFSKSSQMSINKSRRSALDEHVLIEDHENNRLEQLQELKKRIKCAQSARKMMAAIVASYLVCNLLNLVLTFCEHVHIEMLQAHANFYSFASDTVTLLTVVNASFRLPIYYASNLKIRSEIQILFHHYAERRQSMLEAYARKRASKVALNSSAKCQDDRKTQENNANETMPLCKNKNAEEKTKFSNESEADL